MLRALLGERHGGHPENLVRRLRDLKTILDEMSAPEAFRSFFGGTADWMDGRVTDVDHVGFIGPYGIAPESVANAVVEAGFSDDPRIFPSRIVARELGALTGVPSLPTTVVMAYGETRDQRRVGLEIFLPDANEDLVRGWVDRGVSSHLAFTVSDRDAFRDSKCILEERDFRVPAFKRDDPLTVLPWEDGAKFLTMYLDRRDEERSRIELCCVVDRVTPSLFPKRPTEPPTK